MYFDFTVQTPGGTAGWELGCCRGCAEGCAEGCADVMMPKAAPKSAPLDTQRCLELVFEPLKAVEEVVQVPARISAAMHLSKYTTRTAEKAAVQAAT